jgi:alcohol dehydrogenase
MFMEYPYTRIVFGRGSLRRLGMLASAFGGNKALLATGRIFSQKHGHLDEALASLSEKEIEVEVFTGIEPDPADTTVARIADRIKETSAGLLIALGGGSVMDATKMANACFCLDAGMEAFYHRAHDCWLRVRDNPLCRDHRHIGESEKDHS